MNKKIAFASVLMLATIGAFAQENDSINKLDEVVISDSKFALAKEKSGKVIVKITAEDLKRSAGQSLASVLSTVAGVEINGNQSRSGKDLGTYIRGGRNYQILVLIDGVPVTDASGVDLSYDLRLLPVEQIESVEIMKGASSTLYGSGAATGVVNVKLKKLYKQGWSGAAYSNMSTQTTAKVFNYKPLEFKQGFSLNGKTEKISFLGSLNHTESDGISEAKSADPAVVFETDKFSRVNSFIKLGVTPTKKLSLDFFANYDRFKNDFDSGSFSDDGKNYAISKQFRIGFSPKYKYEKGEFVINSGAGIIERDLLSNDILFNFKSRNVSVDVFNKYNVSNQLFFIIGGQFQFHDMSNFSQYDNITKKMAKFNMIDPYFSTVYNADFGLNINVGARLNRHSQYGNNIVYNINPSYVFPNTNLKVLASYSTAFVTPSLYQLYSPYGEFTLSPEQDATIEAGFELGFLGNKIAFNMVGFLREENDAIGFDLVTYKYFNVDGLNKVKGVETMISYAASETVKFNCNYAFSEFEKQSRILNPKHKINANVDVKPTKRLGINLAYQFVSDRVTEYTTYPEPTYDPVLNSEILKDYQLVNANFRLELIKNRLNIFGAVDNILDKDFVETRGFSARGRNFKGGFNFLF
jgi:vitamin B12 transporter